MGSRNLDRKDYVPILKKWKLEKYWKIKKKNKMRIKIT